MCYNTRARGCSSMAERQLPKLNTRVRFPSPAPASAQSPLNYVFGNSLRLLPKTALTTLRLLPNPKHSASDLFFLLRAKSAQLRFRQQPTAIAENCVRSLAPPSKSEALGFGFVFSFARKVRSTSFPATACGIAENCAHYLAPPSKSEALWLRICFLLSSGLRNVRDGVFSFRINAISHSLRRSSFPN